MERYVIGLDQGTTGSFAALMNESGETVSTAYRTHSQIRPQDGWHEQDPAELWQVACDVLNNVLDESGVSAREIVGIGIANQGESVVMWDRRSGDPISNVLVWQDARTQAEVEKLASDATIAQEVLRRTGLTLDSYFSASKIRWMLDHLDPANELLRQNRLACGTLDTWLLWNLTNGRSYMTDVSTASRTLLFNIHTMQWDEWLLDLFNIPAELLPTVQQSVAEFGHVSNRAVNLPDVPVVASLVDQPAAMIGHGCLRPGQVKATYGTGCFINLNTGIHPVASAHSLLTMLAWQREGVPTYALDGGVFTAGTSLNWLRDELQLFDDPQSIDRLCGHENDSGGVMWIPAQVGLGAPYWNRTVRGAWLGISLNTTKANMIRAVLEGICVRVAQIVRAMRADSGLSIKVLRVDGGLTGSETMMQIQADLLGMSVEVVEDRESTAAGMNRLAARAAGLWTSDDRLQQQVRIARSFEPKKSEDWRQTVLDRFERAVSHLEAWHHDR